MTVQVRLAPATAALRCAACHGDLDEPRVVCGACGVALHADCGRGAERCPTLGCRGTGREPAPPTPPRGALNTLLWLFPGFLAFCWPALTLLYLFAFGDPFGPPNAAEYLVLPAGLATGPAVSHLVLVPLASRRLGKGRHHLTAFLATLLGYACINLLLGAIALIGNLSNLG